MMGVRSATARSARSASRPVASGRPRSSSTRSYSTVCSRWIASPALWTTSKVKLFNPASLRWRSTTRASAALSSTNNSRMVLISTSLVLIVALNLVTGWKQVAQPSRPSATSDISASGVKSLVAGGFLPPGAMPFTYRHGGVLLNPTGVQIAWPRTQFFACHRPECAPAADGYLRHMTNLVTQDGAAHPLFELHPAPSLLFSRDGAI